MTHDNFYEKKNEININFKIKEKTRRQDGMND